MNEKNFKILYIYACSTDSETCLKEQLYIIYNGHLAIAAGNFFIVVEPVIYSSHLSTKGTIYSSLECLLYTDLTIACIFFHNSVADKNILGSYMYLREPL